jgi:hypothetical protein
MEFVTKHIQSIGIGSAVGCCITSVWSINCTCRLMSDRERHYYTHSSIRYDM